MRVAILALAASTMMAAALPALAQPLRGRVEQRSFLGPVTGRTVLYNIYLPEGYDATSQRYPVIYHLHGIGGNQGGPQNTSVPRAFEAAQTQGLIGPVIIVFPSSYVDGWWADSFDGAKPAETDVALQLIPHVDAAFRTIATPGARVVEGFSMGGFGATKFYSKFPHLFACCVEYDGAIVTWQVMLQSHAALAQSIFGGSQAYFDQYSPWHWTVQNQATLRGKPPVRMVVAALVGGNRNFRDHLLGLGVGVDYVETTCGHDIGCLMTAQGVASAAFIASHLDLSPPCDADLTGDGAIDQDDVDALIDAVAGGGSGLDADFNGDGNADQTDVDALIAVVAGAPCP